MCAFCPVNEGDVRALFAVLGGHLEVVMLLNGVPRVIGNRRPATSSVRYR